MPIVNSTYTPSTLFKNGHFSTIYPNVFRKVKGVLQKRERIELNDGDFIDIDWSYASQQTTKLGILIHGLEGNAQRQYILGVARLLNHNGWDVTAINLRNCSGEVNRLYQSYHAGVSDDLDTVIHHITTTYEYQQISICGFSLGGNITLKYLGEGRKIPSQITSAVAISVPCDLYDSLTEINKPKNIIYQKRFIRHLRHKLFQRQSSFPDRLCKTDIRSCRSLIEIDNLYTSKAHGYKDALDYYTQCSSKQFLTNIKVPTLIINAQNDSFLGENCYPLKEAEKNPFLFLEIPKYGGHVGFFLFENAYYNEKRTLDFFKLHHSVK